MLRLSRDEILEAIREAGVRAGLSRPVAVKLIVRNRGDDTCNLSAELTEIKIKPDGTPD